MKIPRMIALDTETTGIDTENDRIIQLGYSYREADQIKSFSTFINPGRDIPPDATSLHRISNEMVKDAKPFSEDVVNQFLEHALRFEYITGYNSATFDIPIINKELERVGSKLRLTDVLDPFIFAAWHHPQLAKKKLKRVCVLYDVHLDVEEAHDAAVDSTAVLLLAESMIKHRKIPEKDPLGVQSELKRKLDHEYERYGGWLYHDRQTNKLHVARGKWTGMRPKDLEKKDLRWIVSLKDLTPITRAAFQTVLNEKMKSAQ